MIKWKTETRKVSELIDFPINPREFTKDGMDDLRKSLLSIGYVDLIAINLDNVIIGGHARKQIFTELGYDEIEVRVPDEMLSLKVVKEAVIRLNKNHAGVWNYRMLETEFNKIDLIEHGFKKHEFNSFPLAQAKADRPLTFPIFSEKEILDDAFKVFRKKGFPYTKLDRFEIMIEMNKLASMPPELLKTSILGYAVADSFHNHRFHAAAYGMRSPIQGFEDDASLKKTLRVSLKDRGNLTYQRLPFMTLVNGVQACANFRPAFAKMIYDAYAPAGRVFDSSMGYGGRLVGFLASSAKEYIGTDPSTLSYESNLDIAKAIGRHKDISINNKPIEEFDTLQFKESCDLAFTSPPYFIKELYSTEETQSYIRYRQYPDWIAGFLRPMLIKQFEVLKPGALNIVNIEDIKIKSKLYPLVSDTIELAKALGFTLEKTEKFHLPNRNSLIDEETPSVAASESVLFFRKGK